MALGDCAACLSHKKASCWTMSMGWQWSRLTTVLKFKHAQQNVYGRGGVLSVPTSYNQYFGFVLTARGKCTIALYMIVLFAGWQQSKWRVQERHYKKGLAPSSSMLSLSAAQTPRAHLSRSCQLPLGSAQRCSASSLTFSWEWSFPSSEGGSCNHTGVVTTTTQLASTKPRALYKVWVLFWAPSQSLCLFFLNRQIHCYSNSLSVDNL